MRRVLVSLITVALAAGAVIYGVASFQDTETSAGNSITTGSLDLQLGDGNELPGAPPLGDSVLETWKHLNVAPGDYLNCSTITAQNLGSIDGSEMAINLSHEISDPSGPESDTADGAVTGDNMAKYVLFTIAGWDGVNLMPLIADVDGVPGKSFEDITAAGGLPGLPGILAGGSQSLFICYEFSSAAGNDFQGKTLLTDVQFVLTQ